MEARIALTLRAVVGLTTAQIARAFLVSEATMAQRIVRAKRKIVATRIPLTMPAPDQRAGRLDDVLTVTYLMFNEAFVSTAGVAGDDRDLGDDALWLAGVVAAALPDEPEALGLLALLTVQHARQPARFDASGALVLLEHQDRSLWDRAAIATADGLLERAAAHHRAGRFQLQAAIAACHASAATWAETDWLQILVLYDMLLGPRPLPGHPAQPRGRAGQGLGRRRRPGVRRPAGRRPRRLPPVPRHPGRPAPRARPRLRGRRRGRPGPLAHPEPRRAGPAPHPPLRVVRDGLAVSPCGNQPFRHGLPAP